MKKGIRFSRFTGSNLGWHPFPFNADTWFMNDPSTVLSPWVMYHNLTHKITKKEVRNCEMVTGDEALLTDFFSMHHKSALSSLMPNIAFKVHITNQKWLFPWNKSVLRIWKLHYCYITHWTLISKDQGNIHFDSCSFLKNVKISLLNEDLKGTVVKMVMYHKYKILFLVHETFTHIIHFRWKVWNN